MATCSSADSVLEAASQIKSNAVKLNNFVNGDENTTVQLGSGEPTPSLRKLVNDVFDDVATSLEGEIGTALAGLNGKADKVTNAVEGNLAALDDAGNLTDSGIAAPTVTQDGEFIRRVNDEDGNFLFGIRHDGTVEWMDGVPSPLKRFAEQFFKLKTVPGGQDIFHVVDRDGKALLQIDKNGSVEWSGDIPKRMQTFMQKNMRVRHDLGSQVVAVCEDRDGKALKTTDSSGNSVCFGDYAVLGDVKVAGEIACDKIKGVLNWTKASSIKIPELPKCATINIKGFSRPLTKADERQAVMEFWDGRGNYFEKNILIGLQGNSTWNLPKPNYKFDIIRGGWNDLDEDGDVETCEVQFGEWVPSDSYHLKAFWADITKCRAIVSYKIWEEINKTYGFDKDATWKKAMLPADSHAPEGELPAFSCTHELKLRLDTGATCRFEAFPCIVYHNGKFYGIFAFQQKKQRENFMMDKKNFRNIHLDGVVAQSLCTGVPDYSSFEIRNPSKLVCWDGSNYDGDAPKRLITRDDAAWQNKSKYTNTEITDLAIKALASHMVEIGLMDDAIQEMIAGGQAQADIDAAIADLKTAFETYFDAGNVIDMAVHATWDADWDTVSNNIQWTTWDGVKWFLNRYDANGAFDGNARWHAKPKTISHIQGGTVKNHPFHIVEAYYFDDACARYADLRRRRILDADHFMSMVQEWMLSVGFENYEKEFELWPLQNCLGEMAANSSSWQLVLDEDGRPIRCDIPTASAEDQALPVFAMNSEYQPGDVVQACWTSLDSAHRVSSVPASGYWKLKCVASGPCRGIPPFDPRFINAPDSIFRLYSWIKLQQAQADVFFDYVS